MIFTSCVKDEISIHEADLGGTTTTPPIVFRFGGQQELRNKSIQGTGTRTVLGADRQNPFTVTALDAAHQAVYGSTGQHAATDRYVSFSPTNLQELQDLSNLDIFLLDFPLTRRVVTMGDYWYESKDSTDFPVYYTTVPVGFTFPSVPHNIIADLDLSEGDTAVIAKSFSLTGNEEEYRTTFGSEQWSSDYCFENTEIIDITLCNEPIYGNGDDSLNDCGCLIGNNRRFPGGCVQVDDTQYNEYQGVRRVRITGWNGWFTRQRTFTDDNGCWQIQRRYKGRAYFWLRFMDGDRLRLRVKGRNGVQPLEIYDPAQHYIGRINGPDFNNIEVKYDRRLDDAQGTLGHFTWAAATVNNGVHEFHDMSAAECFNTVPNIDLLIRLKHDSDEAPADRGNTGAAPMLRHLGYSRFKDAVALGEANHHQSSLYIGDELLYVFVRGLLAITWPVSNVVLDSELGDVNVTANFSTSDRQKHLLFHELGHASHYVGAGNDYWKRLIAAEIAARGHGASDSYEAGTIAVGESWAEHVGLRMSSMKYPVGVVPNSTSASFSSWTSRHEQVRNERFNHIPIGIFNDLLDGINLNESVRNENSLASGTLIDNVNGLANDCRLQEVINANHSSMQSVIDAINQQLGNGDAVLVENLFQEYEQ